MYIPSHFEETNVNVMHDLIRNYPLATLVTHSVNGLNANHIPMYLHVGAKPYGCLQGHVSRTNLLLEDVSEKTEVLAIFHGPNAYISPSWYETKREHGKVVPTWNYAVVHAYGKLRILDDNQWLRDQLKRLTNTHEAKFPEPWQVADAPQEFTEKLLQSIIGIEIEVVNLIGKWKVSQNQPVKNQKSVTHGLTSLNSNDKMIELVAEKIPTN